MVCRLQEKFHSTSPIPASTPYHSAHTNCAALVALEFSILQKHSHLFFAVADRKKQYAAELKTFLGRGPLLSALKSITSAAAIRSEERRVGKECRSRWS